MATPVLDPARNLVIAPAYGVGYHTRLAAGTPVHPTRESIGWAVARLAAGDAAAVPVVAAVLDLQDTDPTSPTYGIWPWFAEEPLAAMAPPDWNWADFIGAQLGEILVRFQTAIPRELAERCREGLRHACWSIFRRNVGPGYTNIALMGAAVCAAGARILGDGQLAAYARRRLEAFLDHATRQGAFSEFNSPNYTPLALEECERAMRLAGDPAIVAAADRIRRLAWQSMAEHWHPGTATWAGPCARSYDDRAPAAAALFAAKTGRGAAREAPGWAALGPPCPDDIAPRFAALPQPEVEIVRRCRMDDDPLLEVHATTWMDGEASLGSFSRGSTWVQARSVLAWWRIPGAPAALLRVRLLKDGKDFASGILWSAQRGPRVLSSFGFATDQGDWHCSLDRPADGSFTAGTLTLRIELHAPDAVVEAAGGGWRLRAGGRAACVLPAPDAIADGQAVAWRGAAGDGVAAVEAVLRSGPAGRFAPAASGTTALAWAISVDGGDGPLPDLRRDADRIAVAWQGLELAHRAAPGPLHGA